MSVPEEKNETIDILCRFAFDFDGRMRYARP
jgi:hypothetical protein